MARDKFIDWDLQGRKQMSTEAGEYSQTPEASYLKGVKPLACDAAGPREHGMHNMAMPTADWDTHWRKTAALRRHTVDQGLSTYERDRDFRK